jgi:hypothetical protein
MRTTTCTLIAAAKSSSSFYSRYPSVHWKPASSWTNPIFFSSLMLLLTLPDLVVNPNNRPITKS